MLGWFGRLFRGRTAADKDRQNPAVRAAVQESAQVYNRTPLRELIDEDRREVLARELWLEINHVCNMIDPVTSCRDELAKAMLSFSGYQVLLVPPEPDVDPSGLRGQPGVSGEMKAYLREICEKNDELRSAMFRESESPDGGAMLAIVERLYWEMYWRLGTLNGIRVALGDMVEGDDWYEPFLHAACVQKEHTYRWELELPPAFDQAVAREAAMAYSVFTDIVISGSPNPAREWRDYAAGLGVPMPDFPR